MSGVVEGIRVIDMGHYAAIPSAAAILADWGAEVIKIEPLTGEPARGALDGALDGGILKVNGRELNLGVEGLNRNKKSMAVDLKKTPGKDILYKLVERADVFMSNLRVTALDSLKMDYETLTGISHINSN